MDAITQNELLRERKSPWFHGMVSAEVMRFDSGIVVERNIVAPWSFHTVVVSFILDDQLLLYRRESSPSFDIKMTTRAPDLRIPFLHNRVIEVVAATHRAQVSVRVIWLVHGRQKSPCRPSDTDSEGHLRSFMILYMILKALRRDDVV